MSWHRRLSRLLFGFSHAEHPLNAAQRAAYDTRVRELARADRLETLGAILPGFLAIAAVPLWVRLQQHVSFPLQLAVQVAFAGGIGIYVLYLLRRKHLRHGPRALRELGFADVCTKCGYDLHQQPQRVGRCPECGEPYAEFKAA